jgi:hypothetical protein
MALEKSETTICKICGNPARSFARATLRGKYDARYFACAQCEFIQTEEPHWLKEAYAEPINRSDVGYVSRNVYLSKVTKALIVSAFHSQGKFIDYGGGYGMFVRLMRDAGFDFYRFDKYCPNLFATDFEADASGTTPYDLLTTFEVFEHLVDPIGEIEKMLSFSKSIFFSTELQPVFKPPMSQWSYYALDHGQHVAFYRLRTLQEIARKLRVNLYSDGTFLHLLTPRKISPTLFRFVVHRKIATLIHYAVRKPSLLPRDYEKAVRAAN